MGELAGILQLPSCYYNRAIYLYTLPLGVDVRMDFRAMA